VQLSWSASSDDVVVAGYEIYRNGVLLSTTTGTGTSFTDTSVSPNTAYSYAVRAFDAAGNRSSPSTAATVTTPPGPAPAIGLVKQATGATGTSAVSFTVPIASTTGNTLVAAIAVQAGSTTSVSSVVDSAGNAWSRGPVGFLSGSNTRVELWYSSGAASVTSVTAKLSAPDLASANVSEWRRVSATAPLAASAGQGNASSTTASTPSITTTNPNDVLIGAVNFPGAVTSSLTTPGFSTLDDFSISTVKGRAAYDVVTSAGPYAASWALSGSSTSGAAILALKGAP
jgi:chitodextrinase